MSRLMIDFSGAAIREHYTEDDESALWGIGDDELDAVGDGALNDPALWDVVYRAWDRALATVLAERGQR